VLDGPLGTTPSSAAASPAAVLLRWRDSCGETCVVVLSGSGDSDCGWKYRSDSDGDSGYGRGTSREALK
jgi:hypothetical protein